MLDREYIENETVANTPAVQAVPAAVVPAAARNTAVATTGKFSSPYVELVGKFERELETPVLPHGSTTGCTIIGSSIKFGEDMKHDAGDFIVFMPENITYYEKVSLGVRTNADEKRMEVSCYDRETVTVGEEVLSKAEYISRLKAAGYEKAQFKERSIIHGIYLTCERAERLKSTEGDQVEVKEDDRLFAFYLSPSSTRALKGFLIKTATRVKGSPRLEAVKMGKRSVSFEDNNWTEATFERAPEYTPELADAA